VTDPSYYLTKEELSNIKDLSAKLPEVIPANEKWSAIEIGPGSEYAIQNKTVPLLKALNL